MIWGVESGLIDENRLKPLGLCCDGGSSNKDGMTYHVFSKNDDFNIYVNFEDFKKIDVIYRNFKKSERKEKLKKLNQDD